MKIAMIASEANPLAKTGGLADVVSALSKQMQAFGDEVVIVLPYYRQIEYLPGLKIHYLQSYEVGLGWRKQNVEVYKVTTDGLNFYLLGNEYYFGRDGLYGYEDDGERFAFFTVAVKELFPRLEWAPDIIHTHDWQPGMLPCLIKILSKSDPTYAKTKFVHTIHNPEFKGMLPRNLLGDFYGLPNVLYENGSVRFQGQVSTLKTAIVYADKITTVSPNHAKELLTEEGSKGLAPILRLRQDDFVGIVNGIDYEEWNPAKDPILPHKLNVDPVKWKQDSRKSLIQSVGLHDSGGPLFGMVSRLTFQKGIDIALDAMRGPLLEGAMFFLCGSGEYALEQKAEALRRDFPRNVCIYIGYSNKRAHEIYAASDFFLMPSLFEPCGIGQLIAEHYGSLPIGRETGGLVDTIISYDGNNADKATGVLFKDYDVGGVTYGIFKARHIYEDKALHHQMIDNAMSSPVGWQSSGEKYRELYISLLA